MEQEFYRNYKRTQQTVSNALLHYLYYKYIVCTINNQLYSKVYILSMSILCVYNKVNIL